MPHFNVNGFLTLGLFLSLLTASCSSEKKEKESDEKPAVEEKKSDASVPATNQNWIDIQAQVSRMTHETTYDDITKSLGKPYEEYASPSLPEEYVLFYNVPGVKGAMFWIMLHTETKKFLYWSGETIEK